MTSSTTGESNSFWKELNEDENIEQATKTTSNNINRNDNININNNLETLTNNNNNNGKINRYTNNNDNNNNNNNNIYIKETFYNILYTKTKIKKNTKLKKIWLHY